MKKHVEPLNWSLAGAPKLPVHRNQAFVTDGKLSFRAGKIDSVNLRDQLVLVKVAQNLALNPNTAVVTSVPAALFRAHCFRVGKRAIQHIIELYAKGEQQALDHISEIVLEQKVSTAVAAEPVEKPKETPTEKPGPAPAEKAKEIPPPRVAVVPVEAEEMLQRYASEVVVALAAVARTPEENTAYEAALRFLTNAWGALLSPKGLGAEKQTLVRELREILNQPRSVLTLTQCRSCKRIHETQTEAEKRVDAIMRKL